VECDSYQPTDKKIENLILFIYPNAVLPAYKIGGYTLRDCKDKVYAVGRTIQIAMCIKGSLEDFSLSEIFQFLQKGRRTGLLTVCGSPASQAMQPPHYIWVYQGQIVAAANRLDQQGLVSLIEQLQLVSDRVFDKLVHWCCPIDKPLGLYLKNQGVLRTELLKRLFNIQVLQPVTALFQLQDGQFSFDSKVTIPTREMTGLSVAAGVLSQYGLIEVLFQEMENDCLTFQPYSRNECVNPRG
jgi:hypothetical protein